MKLHSLRVIRGTSSSNWASKCLLFGEHITQLFSKKNGVGKTPLLQATVFALGYPVIFRDDIVSHCGAVRLRVELQGRAVIIWRDIGKLFRVRVRDGSSRQEFLSANEFSRYLLSAWGMSIESLTTTAAKPSPIYLEHILPLFYLDQDNAYSNDYFAPSKFLKDQYSESMRVAFSLAPRNPYDRKRLIIEIDSKISANDEAIARRRKMLEALALEIGFGRRPVEAIDGDLATEVATMEGLKETIEPIDEQARMLDQEISELARSARLYRQKRLDIDAQLSGVERIRKDIEVEASTLSLNEEARRVFLSFGAICSQPGCGLFANSASSYGKSLLYLRDQLKDIDSLHKRLSDHAAQLDVEYDRFQEAYATKNKLRSESRARSDGAALIEMVSGSTRRIIELQKLKGLVESIDRFERELLTLNSNRERLQSERDGLQVGRGAFDADLAKVRIELQVLVVRWLDILNTSNVSRDVLIDSDFVPTFGGERLRSIKGSTLTRVILAHRTACIEALMNDRKFSPRFFILDTPRQQDIDREDFERFIRELKLLSAGKAVQVIFSSTDYRYSVAEHDKDWKPVFPGEDHEMFLG